MVTSSGDSSHKREKSPFCSDHRAAADRWAGGERAGAAGSRTAESGLNKAICSQKNLSLCSGAEVGGQRAVSSSLASLTHKVSVVTPAPPGCWGPGLIAHVDQNRLQVRLLLKSQRPPQPLRRVLWSQSLLELSRFCGCDSGPRAAGFKERRPSWVTWGAWHHQVKG